MVHPGSGQIAGMAAGSKSIKIRDLAITIPKGTPDAIVYRVTIDPGQPIPVDDWANGPAGRHTAREKIAPNAVLACEMLRALMPAQVERQRVSAP